ncbi:unnamed protein product [Orchesella dallaii]|uniref:C2H2-type domain-containing protein n=1 Tax=Orchesella dallaii TaxID=48710 RepID=A0ABP1RRN1_9HEXA
MKAHDNPKCVCIVCGKCCNRPDPLNYHIQTCNLEKAEACFYCSFCDVKFDSKNKRDRHLQSVHKNHYKFEEVCKKVGCQSLLSVVDKSPQAPEQKEDNKKNEIGVGGGGSSSSSVIGVGTGELIDVTTQIKVDISNTLQFGYEGDDDELF